MHYNNNNTVKSKETVGNPWTVLSYFGSQISSQSLNEVHIYRLRPKSATKGDFFSIFLCLIVSSWRHGLQMANEADEAASLKKLRQIKTTENVRTKLQSENVES